ncbi:HsdM family class I SAM-dependent methyltransferase [Priestia megaterium]|uniref:HsdM family class I SAM-dependent methyltransferase n=1 Tax=Priestia megaterium TaxID=1404 RepID=UPI00272FE575|nr:N-6 DNA methylase [Priestia megaterium]MDP1443107.1 N-6 DNA methylase [Priestia megaterium]MDP1472227.1 N-6 DNA methylase [Priestia megaterium]
MSKNERITENIVRDRLKDLGYFDDEHLKVDEQITHNPTIKNCLAKASKSGKGVGKPEFVIHSSLNKDLIIVIECKADVKKHESKTHDRYAEFAVDGVLHYARNLSTHFNVISIAVSGQNLKELRISTFLWAKGGKEPKVLKNQYDVVIDVILTFEEFLKTASYNPDVEKKRYQDLLSFSRELHNYMRDYAKLTETEKPLLVSGILIALSDASFSLNYQSYPYGILASEMYEAIKREVEQAKIPKAKKQNMIQPYSFISVHPELAKLDKQRNETPLYRLVTDIDEKVRPFITIYQNFDVIGQFYGEFLKYTGGDKKSLGIVLTPRHITELFSEIAQLTPATKVLDTCCGTGGFLIAAMSDMIKKSKTEAEIENIKSNGLIGVEQQPNMFALAASNMILRGDGKANLYQGSCFDEAITKEVKRLNADVGMINPPYSQKGEGLHELDFVYHMLNSLKEGGTGIAIVPINSAISSHPMKEVILKEHTLEAVMSMPDDLFHPVGIVTCVMVFTAHKAHNKNQYHKTWFGFWKDDGFVKTKHLGRTDLNRDWEPIKNEWLGNYFSKKEEAGASVLKKVTANDEWCAEAYLETDYSDINTEDFERELKKYMIFKMMEEEK